MTPEEQLKILKRGVAEIIAEEELLRKLRRSQETGKPLKVKAGFDPTAPDLHVGSAVVIRKMRHFQDLGHEVIFLIGDFTGMIGDPSGKTETRRQLSREEVLLNAKTYEEQIYKILNPEKTRIVFNSQWCSRMTFEDVIGLASRYTVARLLERDDFAKRMAANQPISVLELLYPLVQGYDSVALEADVELGGTDQKFNLLVGRVIQREYGLEPQVVLTMPLLEGIDGTQKMSKSLGNHIGINEPPDEIYGKTMSVADELMWKYFALATEVPETEIDTMRKRVESGTMHPKEAKQRLAREIVTLYHGESKALSAEENFEKVFARKELPDETPILKVKQTDLTNGKIWVVKLLVLAGFAKSNAEARRLIEQGGVRINQQDVALQNGDIAVKDGDVLQAGKRRFVQIAIE
ncbi:MAG: tyrosine--tRNA ligase [Candidatus Abyssobacteria bacterium SURF_17]|uniref:Tyrosine--tRNA ligase n=1 Tax=Candidatus Abyssobacteria bacterium SURF_17 TaxID=2093361 RepID=A0A419F2I9_9BACT|nr:MAG: tyrosine--tRNA ligase [Candidatus Abyssubacteria bacterium SURF_17]